MSAWTQYALCASLTFHALFSAVLFAPWPDKDKGSFGQISIEAYDRVESRHEASFWRRLKGRMDPGCFLYLPLIPTCSLSLSLLAHMSIEAS